MPISASDLGLTKSYILDKYGNADKSSSDMLIYKTNDNRAPNVAFMLDGNMVIGVGLYVEPIYGDIAAEYLLERHVMYSINTSKYTASFANCKGKKSSPVINYTGQMAYDKTSNWVIILYYNTNTKSHCTDFIGDMIDAVKE